MGFETFEKKLVELLEDEQAVALTDAYFNRTKANGDPYYSGSLFDDVEGGGDRNGVRDRITSSDIVAVKFLSVDIPRDATVTLLESASSDISSHLADIPHDKDLWEVNESEVAAGSPAHRLRIRLQEIDGIGWVSAYKLLARKRPRLLPVYDNVMYNALTPPSGQFWPYVHRAVQNPVVFDRLGAIREESDSRNVGLLRILDVVIWMRCHGWNDLQADDPVHQAIRRHVESSSS